MPVKSVSPSSILGGNSRNLCAKSDLSHADWQRDMYFVIKRICKQCTSNELIISDTVMELYKLRESIIICDTIDKYGICSLNDPLCTD